MITRRDLLRGVAGTAGLLGWPPGHASGEPPPETTRLRIAQQPSICVAPQFIVTDLLKAEGFTDIKYVKMTIAGISKALASGEVDVSMHFVGPLVIQLDAGAPITVLGGVHVGCFELFGTDRVRTIRDLKGKTVAITELGSTQHVYLSSMVAHVGLDPRKDMKFVELSRRRGQAAARGGKGRRLPRVSAGPSGAARPEGRTRRRQQRGRPAVVAVLLLHRHGSPGVRQEASDRDQAGAAGDPERSRPLRPRA